LPFVVALAGGAAVACVLALLRAWARRRAEVDESTLTVLVTTAGHGLAIAVAALLAAGVVGLRRRDPRTSIGLLLCGAGVMLVAAVARPVCEHFIFERAPDYLTVVSGRRWLGRLDTTGAVAFAAGLIFLGEHVERVRNLTVPLLVLAVVAHPPLGIADRLTTALGDHPGAPTVWKAALVLAAIQVAFAALALAALEATVRTPRPAPADAAADG